MGNPLRICVVGCGRVSKSHLAGMLEIPDKVKVVAVVSRDAEKRDHFCRDYAVPKAYVSLQDALKDPEIEAVVLCLPNHLHRESAILSARAGKHVLMEKPMANTVEDCEAMIRAAEDAGVALMVGQSRRFHNAVLKSKALLDAGKIGSLISITGLLFAYLENPPTDWWRSAEKAGGLIIPLWGNHIIDYVLWMFGKRPERVYCEAYRNNPNWEGEDEVTIVMGFDSNRHSTIKMSWNTKLKEAVEWDGKGKMLSSTDIVYGRYIQGTKGTLHLGDETELKLNGSVVLEGVQVPSNFALQAAELAASVREKREPLTSGKRVVDIIRVQEAALKSARTHKVVDL